MSPRQLSAIRHDEGFSLVEVIVALGIFMIVMMAVLPLILTGVKGTARAAQVTEEKGVVAAQLELMRNLPWHVAPNSDFRIDVLDRYYPDLDPLESAQANATTCEQLPQIDWTGYVDSATPCPYEPQDGPFYRTVERVDPAGPAEYLLVTNAQFLDSAVPASGDYAPSPAAEPTAGYQSTDQGLDVPISQQIGVTVTSFDLRLPSPRPVTDYTQVAEIVRSPQRVQAVAAAAAIEVRGMSRDDLSITTTAGKVDLNTSLARMSTADSRLTAVEARWAGDDLEGPDPVSAFAPPETAAPASTGPSGDLKASGSCDYVCWGTSATSSVPAVADDGLPSIGSSSVPVQSVVDDLDDPALSFSNTPKTEREDYQRPDLELLTDEPLLTLDDDDGVALTGCGASGAGEILGRGYVTTTAASVASCAEAGTATVSLFPTQERPNGVLRLSLDHARATCSSTHGGARVGSATYQVTVQVFGSSGDLTTMTFTETSTAAERQAFQDLLDIEVTTTGRKLRQYVDDWSLATATSSTTTDFSAAESVPAATASVPAALVLTSTAMRNSGAPVGDPAATNTPDPISYFSMRLGAVSCQSLDAR